ncbi:MAG: hypothetical protein HOD72_01005 [Opitutae bacterium]|jgi:hypothetical protein|nr:hypothetical protein [Opitutae bacterium]MBT4223020.1 hypothetical protein [Opitutae bacterium]MBT5377942.1 hypothetical protein [Opitutae bacterium]MBT5690686.1 hypothetical protein [Opitutae bacterium]MBT6462555.1 hypothetical protein [Opitutae bacterium]
MNRLSLIVSLLFFLVSSLMAEKNPKVVFLHGKRSHASGDHEFKAGSHLLAKHLNKQDSVPIEAVVHPGWPKDESILDDAAAVIIYADGTSVIRSGWEKMDQLVQKGVGVLFMHYAVHPGINEGEKYFIPWIGGYFRNGFSVNPFWRADIKPLEGHATARGVGEIKAVDEFYFNIKYHEKMIPLGSAIPNPRNLHHINNLWTKAGYEAKGKSQALLWGHVRPDGSRGAGFTGGHHHRNWAIDGYRKLILNAIVWVAGAKVPEGGVPTYAVTEDELNENLDDYGSKTSRVKLPTKADITFSPGSWMTPQEHAEFRANRNRKKK